MKYVINILSVFISLVLISNFGFVFGGTASLIVIGCSVMLNDRINYIKTLNHYSNLYENIYVVSNHPYTNEPIVLSERLQPLIVSSSFKKVHNTIEYEKKWLKDARNPFFVDISLNDEQKIKLIPIIYQDGINVNENWKSFKKRVAFEIKEDRAKRHEMLKNTNEMWYQQYSNNQLGIVWNRE